MNKKIFILIIVLILAVTGLVFLLKYKGIIFSPKTKPPGGQEIPKIEKPKSVKIESHDVSGRVVSIDEKEMVVLGGEEEIRLDITSAPTAYLMEGEKRIEKKVSDLKKNSVIQLRYLDNGSKKVPLVIEIEKL